MLSGLAGEGFSSPSRAADGAPAVHAGRCPQWRRPGPQYPGTDEGGGPEDAIPADTANQIRPTPWPCTWPGPRSPEKR
jgi:hypothetical protein